MENMNYLKREKNNPSEYYFILYSCQRFVEDELWLALGSFEKSARCFSSFNILEFCESQFNIVGLILSVAVQACWL